MTPLLYFLSFGFGNEGEEITELKFLGELPL